MLLPQTPARQRRRYSIQPFYLSLLVFTLLAIASLVFEKLENRLYIAATPKLRRRSLPDSSSLLKKSVVGQCHLVRNAKDQCSFVRINCPDHDDGLFSYLQFYYCTLAHAKPLAFIIIIAWLSLLFSTIGIAASDFLCINLSTLASILGMSESLTGVTFLAFGNGSPDVFSTLAAMRSNSGSLAVGELIGAAGFITSVVAGSMALIRPFRVARRSFVRDVGYFVIAVAFSMVVLADGRLNTWESAAMVGLYCFYVVTVVTWHWYRVRRRRTYERNVAARTHFHIPENQELDIDEVPEDDDPEVAESRSLLHGASTEDFNDLEQPEVPVWKDEEDDETRNRYLAEIRDNMRVSRPVTSRRRNTFNPIRPSLVGALEFQSVLSSLMKSRNTPHQHFPVNFRDYSDDFDALASYQLDNRSVVSHPHTTRPSTEGFLSPNSAWASARTRAVSANDVSGLKLDTDLFNRNTTRPARESVSRPSREPIEGLESTQLEPAQIGQRARLTVSPLSSTYQSRSSSRPSTTRARTPELLAPPHPDTFRVPDYQLETALPLSPLGLSPRVVSPSLGNQDSQPESPIIPFPPFQDSPSPVSSRAPSIRLPPAASSTELLQIHNRFAEEDGQSGFPVKWWPYRILPPPESLLSTLFPSLYGWTSKSIWERLLGIIAAPSVLLLTITLPVIEPPPPDAVPNPITVVVTPANNGEDPAPFVRLPEDSPLITACDDTLETEHREVIPNNKPHRHSSSGRSCRDSEALVTQEFSPSPAQPRAKEWNRWLLSIQLFAGPFFISVIGWTSMDPDLRPRNLLLPSLCSLLFSLLCFTVLIVGTRHGRHSHLPSEWRPFLSMLGFVVSICWIATIATEVVSLLKTIGVILNISDSLLGLTVFAVGNSLGDLVADVTVARLGYPVMALSACFGGPMLNILLGIGIGGLYMTWNSPRPEIIEAPSASRGSYEITVSKVLVISGATLLITLVSLLVIVPLNKWKMDRKIGWGLIALWGVSTLGNVVAEVVT